MQKSTRVSHGAILLLSSAAAVAICYTAYRQLWQSDNETSSDTKLHRSNAVRRRRRAWRSESRVAASNGHDTSRVDVAMEHLLDREMSGTGYGYYHNCNYVDEVLASAHGEDLALLPSRLASMCGIISQAHSMSVHHETQLTVHVHAMFVQSFLKEEFSEGQITDQEGDYLAAKLRPEVDAAVVSSVVEIVNKGQDVDEDMLILDMADAQDQIEHEAPNAEDLASALRNRTAEDRRNLNGGRWNEDLQEANDGNNVLDLLYRIGEEKAKWSGYQHRGVQCNGCAMTPIRGIRYHCANCWDYDLCEACEHQQIHHKTHVFYKIRIPAPTRGQIKLVQPKWYPGDPNACPESMPQELKTKLLRDTNVDRQDLDALYDQFKCIAGKPKSDSSDGIGMVIDRRCFDKYFTSTTADRPPRPNLIYDRIFSFYDKDRDGFISFSEFAIGMADLANNTSREARVERLFKAFDIDGDGHVSRRDFLHMLQAYYTLNKELAHEMVFARDDALLTDEEMLEVIHGSNPISAAFGGSNFPSHRSRHGQVKHIDSSGELILDNHMDGVFQEDSILSGDRAEAIARQASDARGMIYGRQVAQNQQQQDEPVVYGYHLPPAFTLRDEDSIMGSPRSANVGIEHLGHIADSWPIDHIQQQDVQRALGADIPMEDVMDPMDRRRVLNARRDRLFDELETNNAEVEADALHDRWRHRSFYTDAEQGFSMPAGYSESDSSDDDPIMNGHQAATLAQEHAALRRSRSSSKVRFDESTIENDNESKSDVSSRNTPVNERWGGFEMSQPDRDVGVEIIYEAVQEAFNDMLDHFFKREENEAMKAQQTRRIRRQHQAFLHAYSNAFDQENAQLLRENGARVTKETVTDDFLAKIEKRMKQNGDIPEATQSRHTLEQVASKQIAHDPTLPQNRPNAEGFMGNHDSTSISETIMFDKRLLLLWHEHNSIEVEAYARGGYGRLNKSEFRSKLREEHPDIDIGSEAAEVKKFWDTKADLGKFSFLSDWLEMASF